MASDKNILENIACPQSNRLYDKNIQLHETQLYSDFCISLRMAASMWFDCMLKGDSFLTLYCLCPFKGFCATLAAAQ